MSIFRYDPLDEAPRLDSQWTRSWDIGEETIGDNRLLRAIDSYSRRGHAPCSTVFRRLPVKLKWLIAGAVAHAPWLNDTNAITTGGTWLYGDPAEKTGPLFLPKIGREGFGQEQWSVPYVSFIHDDMVAYP